MILKNGFNYVAIQVRVVNQLTVFPTDKPSVCTNPKTSVAGAPHASDIAAGEMFPRRGLPWEGPPAVEPEQAKFRAQPKISVGRLSDRPGRPLENPSLIFHTVCAY